MIRPVSKSEKLLFTTTRILVDKNDKKIHSATGFFYDHIFDFEGKYRQLSLLFTNKHVVRDAKKGTIWIHKQMDAKKQLIPSDDSIPIELNNFEDMFFKHDSQAVDLAAMVMSDSVLQIDSDLWNSLFYTAFSIVDMPTENTVNEIGAVNDVIMVGYPMRLWDDVNNLPIFRRGITATHPFINYKGGHSGLLDIACFPGSSGSPVLIHTEGYHATKTGGVSGSTRSILIGVVYAASVRNVKGSIDVEEIPTDIDTFNVQKTYINIGHYILWHDMKVLATQTVNKLAHKGKLKELSDEHRIA